MPSRAPLLLAIPALLVSGCGCGGGGGGGEDDGRAQAPKGSAGHAPAPVAGDRGAAEASAGPASANEPSEPAPDAGVEDRPGGPRDQAAVALVRRYVTALDGGDGATICRIVAPKALRRVPLPRRRRTCAASVSASIGYRNPRGSPQWRGAAVVGPPAVTRAPYGARVVVPLRTRFADRAYVSREDDVVYLRPKGEGWQIAKPSAVFFRAIGRASVPPTVLAPPR
ncbi:MAG TPA: hypothetical protein VKA89_09850 [Solirubrobacterales bacterium]|nr:hypothetical protein [Solirubrobacterales bacterium]